MKQTFLWFFRTFLIVPLLILPLSASSSTQTKRPVSRAEIIQDPVSLEIVIPGIDGAIPYKKFGKFLNVGTTKYRYKIKKKKDLSDAAGQGIFPNRDTFRDPVYRRLRKSGQLEGNHWKFIETRNTTLNFYKWATITTEDPGVKQFYLGIMLERAGHIEQAIKAFYAVAVHFPKTLSWTYYKTPWYVGATSLDRVEQLLRRHPDILMKLKGGEISMRGTFNKDTKDDVFTVDPGKLVNIKKFKEPKRRKLKEKKVVKTIGGPRVQLKKYKSGDWKLFVDGEHFPIKGLTYSLAPVGVSPDRGTWNPSRDWQLVDTNQNGIHDGFFESFVDKNLNNIQDEDEPTVGDAQLIKDMGINTLRVYHHLYDKKLFRRLYEEYGIHVLAGDVLGGYAVGSGAEWHAGTDYRDPKQRETMRNGVRSLVEEYKDEPYILMWVIGNENVYGVANNSIDYPEVFYEFVNEIALMIKEIDPTRPVAHANGDLANLNIFAEKCPDVDVFGANVYRGEQGFGRHLLEAVRAHTDKPVLITEYGAPAIAEGFTQEEAEAFQAMYVANNWDDIENHMDGLGAGNLLGGVLFEFLDEWWKANSDLPLYVQKQNQEWYDSKAAQYKDLQPENHDEVPQFGLPFLDGWSYEEWFGLVRFGNGENSPFVRQLRPSYFTMKDMLR